MIKFVNVKRQVFLDTFLCSVDYKSTIFGVNFRRIENPAERGNSTDFIGASQNLKFEFRYNDDILNTADLMLGNVKYEFKSWLPNTANPWNGFFTGTNSSYNQFIKYLENSASLGEIKYVFNVNKVDITTVKNAFKDLFIDNAEQMFNNLGQDKINQLFKLDGMNNITNFNQFKSLLNNNQVFLDNALKFIKVE